MRTRGKLSKSEKASEARIKAERDAELKRLAAIKSQSETLSIDAKQATKEVKLVKRDAKHIRDQFRSSFIKECRKLKLNSKACKASYIKTLKKECKHNSKKHKDCKLL